MAGTTCAPAISTATVNNDKVHGCFGRVRPLEEDRLLKRVGIDSAPW
jgi:hypothetical protein